MTISSLAVGGVFTAALVGWIHWRDNARNDGGFATLVSILAGLLFWAGYLVASIGSVTITFGK